VRFLGQTVTPIVSRRAINSYSGIRHAALLLARSAVTRASSPPMPWDGGLCGARTY